jgi:hypothetical protein
LKNEDMDDRNQNILPAAMCMICALLDPTGAAVGRSLSATYAHLMTMKYRDDCSSHFPEYREIHI